ncbi:hypothetical protein IHQ71_06910 [Rhizobium sp. TH2]|uniref:hypothetical protein n=1 Tax=Rhizobium sp. TH2 TaxID=2775403 RepID=UPI0021570E00|nr:hypothetical protein [Rhizobium sp. TH2]UVC10328.1 hypothetical protein IHQ71_06910 [Rhizobium sp. TH2]
MTQQNPDAFIDTLITAPNLAAVRSMADDALAMKDVTAQRRTVALGSLASPFFVPSAKAPGQMQLNTLQLQYFLAQARASAAQTNSERVIVSAPMKSGSTFISAALGHALQLPKMSLLMLLARPYDYAVLGAAARPHEIDELALLNACLTPNGFVAHHHMVCTPFLARQAELYNLKFVLMKRNIFDCLISLDDFCLKNLGEVDGSNVSAYTELSLPRYWSKMEFEERMNHLLDRSLMTYVHYHVSWALLERAGLIKPFWISYENELIGDKAELATRLSTWLGYGADVAERLSMAFEHGKGDAGTHFNKGVAGRGSVIQGAARKRVVDTFEAYSDLADWRQILG